MITFKWARCLGLVLKIGLLGLPSRISTVVVALIGIGSVVAVMATLLSIGNGIKKTLDNVGRDHIAIVLRSGSPSETASMLTGQEVQIIAATARQNTQIPNAKISADALVLVDGQLSASDSPANLPIRGISNEALAMQPDFAITRGRLFETGKRELVVGRGAAANYRQLDVGNVLHFGPDKWNIVGQFSTAGSAAESELWADIGVVQSGFNRRSMYQSVKAEIGQGFQAFADALENDPRIDASVRTEPEFFSQQSGQLLATINILAIIVGMVMGLGATASAVNAFNILVTTRVREICTLRAVGFDPLLVGTAVLIECTTIGLIGGLIGGALAYLLFDGLATSTLNWQSLTQLTFEFSISIGVLTTSLAYALLIGLAGSFWPALSAARIPIAKGVRAT